MNCKHAIKLIVKGKSSPKLTRHLSVCESCSEKFNFIQGMEELKYEKIEEEIEVSYGFADKVIQKIQPVDEEDAPVCLSRFERLSLSASVAAIGIILGLILGFNSSRGTSSGIANKNSQLKQFMETYYLSPGSNFNFTDIKK